MRYLNLPHISALARFWSVGTQLYTFCSPFRFTDCGAAGAAGPQNTSSAYTQPWTTNSSYFSISGNGTQQWTVPQTDVAAVSRGWCFLGVDWNFPF